LDLLLLLGAGDLDRDRLVVVVVVFRRGVGGPCGSFAWEMSTPKGGLIDDGNSNRRPTATAIVGENMFPTKGVGGGRLGFGFIHTLRRRCLEDRDTWHCTRTYGTWWKAYRYSYSDCVSLPLPHSFPS